LHCLSPSFIHNCVPTLLQSALEFYLGGDPAVAESCDSPVSQQPIQQKASPWFSLSLCLCICPRITCTTIYLFFAAMAVGWMCKKIHSRECVSLNSLRSLPCELARMLFSMLDYASQLSKDLSDQSYQAPDIHTSIADSAGGSSCATFCLWGKGGMQ
jgi:hypothetical protein